MTDHEAIVGRLTKKKVSRLKRFLRRSPFSLTKRPCQVIDYGAHRGLADVCGQPTHRRKYIPQMKHHAVDCGKHELTRWGG